VFEDTLGKTPLARIAEQNVAMFKAAASAFMPGGASEKPAAPAPTPRDELDSLRAQMAEIQKKLDSLSS
jgi:polyhydroxyalkanoate synthesis regulator protein